MGLCAFMLPACSSLMRTEDSSVPAGTAPGYVLMNRNGTPQPANTRLQRMEGPSAPAPLDAVAASSKVPMFPPDKPDELSNAIDAAAKVEIVQVKHEKAVPTELPPPDSLLLLKPMKPPGPAKNVFPQSDSPLIAPAWPTFGGLPGEAPSIKLPDAGPKAELAPPALIAPSQSAVLFPTFDIAPPPDAVKPVEPNVSMKLPEPATTTVAATSNGSNEMLLLQAMKAFQTNRPQEAVEHLKHLDSTNQELLIYLMPLMVRLSEGKDKTLPPEELAMLVDRLQTASGMLKAKAALQMDRVCFCRGVRKFADLDAYPAGHEFHAGDMVFLYAELKNFTCESVNTQQGQGYNAPTRGCNVRLTTTLELRDAKQALIWRTDLNKSDYSLTPPLDYYHNYRFCIPEKLPAGTYTLWVNIVDKPSGRAVRKPVEMRVGQS